MRTSKWTFNTSSGGSVGVGALAAGGGSLFFERPDGANVNFIYSAGGVSLGLGVLKLGKTTFSLTGSSKDMWNVGGVYISDSFTGADLDIDDFTGFCVIGDVTVSGGVGGGSATAMYLGLDSEDLLAELGYDPRTLPLNGWIPGMGLGTLLKYLADFTDLDFLSFLRTKAKALVLVAGLNKGVPSASISKSVGRVWLADGGVQYVPPVNLPVSVDPPGMRFSSQAKEEAPPIVLPGDALFAFDRYDLSPHAVVSLRSAKEKIGNYPDRAILIEGHTDSFGSVDYNLTLSQNRAETVQKWFSDNGVANKMYAKGYGKAFPVATNKMPAGRKQNRRVEIYIMQASWSPPGRPRRARPW
jgi:outer membrane protein OmpA-like peptidoglycan-associated protein